MDNRRNTRPAKAGEWMMWTYTRRHTRPAIWVLVAVYVSAMIGIVNIL